ncbi:PAS domain S-box protein, partial [Providencia stuartii]|nr:PAS domain S-box protein [Providencia stuartii]
MATRDVQIGGLRDQFSLVLDAATDFAIILTDPDGFITRWSRGAEHLFGWSADNAEGRSAEMFFTPEDLAADRVNVEMRDAREKGRAADDRWHLREDGSRVWASGEMQPL